MKRSSIQRTTKSLLNMRDCIRFDLPFQRNSIWKNDRRSYLVDMVSISALYNRQIGRLLLAYIAS